MSMVHTDAVFFEDDKAFETWLVDNASTATHVWVRMAKKGTGVTSIDWTRAVDVALCFGWIDGIARRLDDEWYVQRFTPRRARSVWSKINRERIERPSTGSLEADHRVTGLGRGCRRKPGIANRFAARSGGRMVAAGSSQRDATDVCRRLRRDHSPHHVLGDAIGIAGQGIAVAAARLPAVIPDIATRERSSHMLAAKDLAPARDRV